MKAVMTSNDPVRISWAQSVLSEARIESFVLDTHMSVLEGSVGILPRRLCVLDEDESPALQQLREAETGLAVLDDPVDADDAALDEDGAYPGPSEAPA